MTAAGWSGPELSEPSQIQQHIIAERLLGKESRP
jgi:hypothetical protein